MQPLPQHLPIIRRWITLCAALVVLMVAIGGLTRLTESGLSITEWKLFSGILPPVSEQAWRQEFAAYQTSPEYRKINADFTLADFKHIFWLEYLHRLLGRIVGLALLLPFLYFTVKQMLPPKLIKRMALACLLVAAQGAVGWIMVASGLVDQPRVEPLKLALHLSLALALFSLLLWTRWQITEPRPAPSRGAGALRLLAALFALQIIFGALVAGLDAGTSYNTFPLMDGRLVPNDLHLLSPWWVNHLENIRTVQFQHRLLAWIVALGALWVIASLWKSATEIQRNGLKLLLKAVILQFSLGVATLISAMNIALASAHQLGAVLLLGAMLRLLWVYPAQNRAN